VAAAGAMHIMLFEVRRGSLWLGSAGKSRNEVLREEKKELSKANNQPAVKGRN